MIYKQYGNTDMRVSAVGFGGMRFDMEKDLSENADLFIYAREKGINYFDTAPGYCGGLSEEIFGLAIERLGRDRDNFYVSTKGMPVKFDTADKAYDAVRASMDKMKVDKIDFYHVWCLRKMDHYHLAVKPGGQYEGLLRCQEEGLIDHIVVSTHMPGNEVVDILKDGLFKGVLLGANILNFPYRWQGVQKAYDMGLAVVAMNPLSGGLIPQNEDKFSFLCKGDETPTEAALEFLIGCPQITITLNGFTTKEHVDTACRVADRAQPLTQADIDRLGQHLGENMNAICTGCGYCVPQCPKKIPIDSYMLYYNHKQMFDKSDDDMVNQLSHDLNWGMLVGRKAEAADCIECGRCETACTQHLPIIERLHKIADYHQAYDRNVAAEKNA